VHPRRGEKEHGVGHPRDHKEDVKDEVPVAGHADRVAPARQSNQRAEHDRVLLGRPHPIGRNRTAKTQPLLPRGAVNLRVEPRVIREYLQPRAHDDDQEEEGQQMRPAHERRDALRHRRTVRDTEMMGHQLTPGAAGRVELGGEHDHQTDAGEDRDRPPHREEAAAQSHVHPGQQHPGMALLVVEQGRTQVIVLQLSLVRGRPATTVPWKLVTHASTRARPGPWERVSGAGVFNRQRPGPCRAASCSEKGGLNEGAEPHRDGALAGQLGEGGVEFRMWFSLRA